MYVPVCALRTVYGRFYRRTRPRVGAKIHPPTAHLRSNIYGPANRYGMWTSFLLLVDFRLVDLMTIDTASLVTLLPSI